MSGYFGKYRGQIIIMDERNRNPLTGNLKADRGMFRELCTKEDIIKIDVEFEKFFNTLYNNCWEEKNQSLLNGLKEHIKYNYYLYLSLTIDYRTARNFIKQPGLFEEGPITKEEKIGMAIKQMYFLADICFTFWLGDKVTIEKIVKRFDQMTGKKLPEGKRNVLLKIINHRNELKSKGLSSHKYSWRIAIRNVYAKLSEQERKRLLGIDLKDKNIDIRRSLTTKNFKTISETISHHQKVGNLPQ